MHGVRACRRASLTRVPCRTSRDHRVRRRRGGRATGAHARVAARAAVCGGFGGAPPRRARAVGGQDGERATRRPDPSAPAARLIRAGREDERRERASRPRAAPMPPAPALAAAPRAMASVPVAVRQHGRLRGALATNKTPLFRRERARSTASECAFGSAAASGASRNAPRRPRRRVDEAAASALARECERAHGPTCSRILTPSARRRSSRARPPHRAGELRPGAEGILYRRGGHRTQVNWTSSSTSPASSSSSTASSRPRSRFDPRSHPAGGMLTQRDPAALQPPERRAG